MNLNRPALRGRAFMAGALATAASMLVPGVAHAALPAGEVAVAIAGSDTTDKVMTAIAGLSGAQGFTDVETGAGTANPDTRTFNIPALGSPAVNVPGDADCTESPGDPAGQTNGDTIWEKDPLAPGSAGPSTQGWAPFGSGSGKAYLTDENDGTGPRKRPVPPGALPTGGANSGCIDVARSSSGPGGTDPVSFDYYAYAMDAVSWASTSLKAPAALSVGQLVSIYDCGPEDAAFAAVDADAVTNNWAEVGGVAGTIQRYYAQAGSGTRSFFSTDILGKPSSYTPPVVAGCPNNIDVEESNGKAVNVLHIDQAVLPYSAAVWTTQQANKVLNPALDLTNGARLNATINPLGTASPIRWVAASGRYRLDNGVTGVVKETNVKLVDSTPDFPGIRYVFNVMDSTGNKPGFVAARQLFGFDNNTSSGSPGSGTGLAAGSRLCANSAAANTFNTADEKAARTSASGIIQGNGFAPLATVGGDASKNLAGSTCRAY